MTPEPKEEVRVWVENSPWTQATPFATVEQAEKFVGALAKGKLTRRMGPCRIETRTVTEWQVIAHDS